MFRGCQLRPINGPLGAKYRGPHWGFVALLLAYMPLEFGLYPNIAFAYSMSLINQIYWAEFKEIFWFFIFDVYPRIFGHVEFSIENSLLFSPRWRSIYLCTFGIVWMNSITGKSKVYQALVHFVNINIHGTFNSVMSFVSGVLNRWIGALLKLLKIRYCFRNVNSGDQW